MDQFNNAHQSHQHALHTLERIAQFSDYLDSLETVADMGCGSGMDINWWARLETIDEIEHDDGRIERISRPRNLKCYAVDQNVSQIEPEMLPASVKIINGDFEKQRVLSREVDFIWSHNSFQYAVNPLNTLKLWNEQMNVNGMLAVCFPMQSNYVYNRLISRSTNYSYFNHNFISLVYMLAVNGFDCRDAYFLKNKDDPWLHACVYKSNIPPMDPTKTSWYDLADKQLINDSMINSLNKYGYMRQEDIYYVWLDRDWHLVED
jgi:trans-aconitate methyltransferase